MGGFWVHTQELDSRDNDNEEMEDREPEKEEFVIDSIVVAP